MDPHFLETALYASQAQNSFKGVYLGIVYDPYQRATRRYELLLFLQIGDPFRGHPYSMIPYLRSILRPLMFGNCHVSQARNSLNRKVYMGCMGSSTKR